MVDRNLVLRKLTELETYFRQIQEFSSISAEGYLADWKAQRIIERTLQMMIEICVDIANHIIADGTMRTPMNYADTFRVLSENNIIGPELLGPLESMAKFRNVIVHQYEVVDAEIVVAVLRRHLEDFLKFRDAVLEHLRS